MARILAVDDQEEILVLLARMLSMSGYVVITASNGQEALDRVREQAPDLIVTDLMMPVMSGKDLLRALRQDPATANIPVIVLSAFADGDLEGANAILRKPFMHSDLIAQIEELIHA